MRKVLLVIAFIFYASTSLAAECCYCETGTYPLKEKKFFRLGCKNWLLKQKNCSVKKIVEHGYDYAHEPLACESQQIKIGYVGHWRNSEETIDYLNEIIIPAADIKKLNVIIDNTACRAMVNPQMVQRFLASQTSVSDIEFRGNQVISVGEWDRLFGPGYNLWAKVSTKMNGIQYPSCASFEGKLCLQSEQMGEEGLCVGEAGLLRKVRCCLRLTEELGSGQTFAWTEPHDCIN